MLIGSRVGPCGYGEMAPAEQVVERLDEGIAAWRIGMPSGTRCGSGRGRQVRILHGESRRTKSCPETATWAVGEILIVTDVELVEILVGRSHESVVPGPIRVVWIGVPIPHNSGYTVNPAVGNHVVGKRLAFGSAPRQGIEHSVSASEVATTDGRGGNRRDEGPPIRARP